jgi:lactate permease
MLLLAEYRQALDPLGMPWLSTFLAALPILVLFVMLVPMRLLAPWAGLGGALTALAVAIVVYHMPWQMAVMSFVHGVGFGLLPTGWNILFTMFLYNITVESGQFTIIRRSVAGISADARIQAVLVGFAFGAFLEGSAGGGTPVAICGAIMVGLGFRPFQAAVLCLIANTSPVAYGGLGTPLIVLNGVTGLPTETLSVMAGHQLPILSLIIPLWMVKTMCSWRQTWEVMPVLAVAGASFAVFQFTFATIHVYVPSVVLYPMTDIGGGIFSLIVTAIFLRFWKPRREMHVHTLPGENRTPVTTHTPGEDARHYEATELVHDVLPAEKAEADLPLTRGRVALAWTPYAIMSVLLLISGFARQREQNETIYLGPLQSEYKLPVAGLHQQVLRDARLLLPEERDKEKPENAIYRLSWLSAPGTAVLAAALISMVMLRMKPDQMRRVIAKTIWQMRIPIPTIALMIGLSYVTRYSGMDATLGYAFAGTGLLYPFFAAILGWLGVFLTGTDAGSNALFGSLQKITATQIFNEHGSLFGGLDREQVQVLICTANSTGGVMGKMIDAQSICVATAATHQLGKEADIFKAVFWHSIVLAAIVGALVMLQAYVWPFQAMVP